MNKQFQKNCQLWALKEPRKAILLPYVNLAGFESVENLSNLKITIDNISYNLYQKDAEKEAIDWFNDLKIKDQTVLYVYGIGLGAYYNVLKKWLKSNPLNKVIFIEDSLAIIYYFFNTDIAKAFLQDSQAHLYYYEGVDNSYELFDTLYWLSFKSNIEVSSLLSYENLKKTSYEKLKAKLEYDMSIKDGLLQEYLEYGVGFYKNFYPNILCLEGSYLGDHFAYKFKNVPAIICGAGPSLEKNMQFLKEISHKALIFAGGSAINVLNTIDLQPHFGAGIDPNAPQYDRLISNTAFEVPYFYRNRLFSKAFETIHGPHLYVTGSGGYDISKYIEKNLSIDGVDIEEGHNVVNFSLEIANVLGCNPIIFVGMDLGFTDMKAYGPGVVENNIIDETVITQKDYVDKSAILKKDIHGKPLYTLWKWIAEADWMSNFAKENPSIKLINATEGGLGFEGVENLTLKEVDKKYLKNTYDFVGMIHSAMFESGLPQVKKEKIKELLLILQASLVRCVDAFTILMEESEVIIKRVKKEKEIPFPLQTGKASLYESELAEEIAYEYVLHMFNEAYTRVLNRELQELNSPHNKISEKKKVIGKIEILNKRFSFLKDVALVNIELMNHALIEDKNDKVFSTAKVDSAVQKLSAEKSIFKTEQQILSISTRKNGKAEGKTETFYPNGAVYSTQNFVNGHWDGEQAFYYPDGTLKTKLIYKDRALQQAVLYHVDGSIKRQISYPVFSRC